VKRLPRPLRYVLLGLLALELLYVATGFFLVRGGKVLAWVNRHPEKRTITFESAWSVVPGLVHVRGGRLVNQGRGNQFEVVVDQVSAFVHPLELLARRVHVLGLRARGVEFRYRKRPKTAEEAAAAGATHAPPIEGVPFEPYTGPPPVPRTKPAWTVVFTGAAVRDLREFWFDAVRVQGRGRVAASLTVAADQTISIRKAEVVYEEASLRVGGVPALEDAALRLSGRMERFDPKQVGGEALLPLITARADLSGAAAAAAILNRYFGKAGWLEFHSGKQRLAASVAVVQGRIEAGSHAELEEETLGVRFAGFIAEGRARAGVRVGPSRPGEEATTEIKVAFADYGMRRQAEGAPVLRGQGLLLEARSPADLKQVPPDDFEGRLEFGRAEFPDLTFVNELLPGGGGMSVRSGRATLEGGFAVGANSCHGEVKIATKGLLVAAGGVDHRGHLEVLVKVPEGNPREKTFALDGTRIDLSNFAFTSEGSAVDERDWQGRLALTDAGLDLRETPSVSAKLDLGFSDTRPLVAFLARDEPLAGWKEKLVTIEEIRGEGVVEMRKGTVTIRHLGVHGEKLDVKARVLVDPRGAFGKARARYGGVKAGIGLLGKDRDLTLLRVGTWYRKDDIRGMPPLLTRYGQEPDHDE
jgi:hypothetical protein